jgi:hypothetical protein
MPDRLKPGLHTREPFLHEVTEATEGKLLCQRTNKFFAPNNAKQHQTRPKPRNPPPHVGGYGREKGMSPKWKGEGPWGVLGARVLGAA